MGRAASCEDNAAMESIFSLLQKNVLDRHTWTTRKQLRIAIVIWIERTYHRRRRQHWLGRLTPIEFENHEHASLPGCVTTNCHLSVQQTLSPNAWSQSVAALGTAAPR